MKSYLLQLSCDNFPNLCIQISFVLNAFGNFSSSRIHKFLPLGAETVENLKASRPLIHVLVTNDNHYGLTLFI
jgi:hypothetical protein